MEFIFTDECKTGIKSIDSEHEYLFSLMNEIVHILDTGWDDERNRGSLENYVTLFQDYGRIHFANEEQYMEERNDIELGQQKREHKMFMDKMNSIDFQDLNSAEKKALLEDTLRYMVKWLFYHILGSDTLIGKMTDITKEIKNNTDFILFSSKYITGIPQVDEEHKKLFDIIEDAFKMLEGNDPEAMYDDIMHLLDELEDYTINHFAHEEEFMQKIQYPYKYIKQQKLAHDIFTNKLRDRYIGERLDSHKEFLEETLDFLCAWLVTHIMKMDKMIGAFYKETVNK